MITRRKLMTGGAGTLASLVLADRVRAQTFVDASTFGLEVGAGDQTQALQGAINTAVEFRQTLLLPAGTYTVNTATIAGSLTIKGSGQTILRQGGSGSILQIAGQDFIVLDGLVFEGTATAEMDAALLDMAGTNHVVIRDCRFAQAAGNGISAHNVNGRIENCVFSDIADTAIFSTDSRSLDIEGNTITRCGNGGVRVWRSESGADGSRIFGNRISQIDWTGGGDGQNGNGINIFRADGVSVMDNHLVNCSFSAIRLNATNDTRVIGNHCENSGEVSIFSEFGFSGSIISHNIVEGGAAGISMTNFDHGGRLSVCQGNIVRNIAESSRNNPDTVPYGIAAEADATVTGNIIEAVPGTGIVVGWGPHLRDVLISDNLVRNCDTGIAVSVADGAGRASITGNVVSGARQHAIIGAQWDKIVINDLGATSHANITLAGNTVI